MRLRCRKAGLVNGGLLIINDYAIVHRISVLRIAKQILQALIKIKQDKMGRA